MAIGPIRSIRQAFAAAFAERRIYLRSRQRTRYIALGVRTQVAGLAAATAIVAWTGFTTAAYVGGALDGHAVRNRLASVQEAYETRVAALGDQQRALEEQLHQANLRRDEVTGRLSDKQSRLVATANRLQEAEAELAVLRGEYERMIDLRREDHAQIDALGTRLAEAEAALAEAEIARANLEEAFGTFTGTVDRVIAERDDAVAGMARLSGELSDANGELGRMQDREERLLSQLEDAARLSLDGLERMFGNATIDLDRILTQAQRDYTGAGGPFVPLRDGDALEADTSEGDKRVAALMQDLESVNLMRFAADRLPFGEPVYGGRRTSGFGPRRDPKGRGYSLHAGLDIAGPRGTPIYTTADGIVTYAGRQRGYGLVVKIRHAFGFETVYAHLSRARVKVGQRVSRGDRVADMGSTGRSTGTHLHYEIRIDKEPVNPLKFIEAARDVL